MDSAAALGRHRLPDTGESDGVPVRKPPNAAANPCMSSDLMIFHPDGKVKEDRLKDGSRNLPVFNKKSKNNTCIFVSGVVI